MGTRSEMQVLAVRWMERGWQQGDEGMVDELHSAGFIDHGAPAGQAPDRAGFKEGIRQLYAAFPDFHAEIDDLVLDPETGKAAIRWSASGTHRGAFLDIAPTGRRIQFQGIEIIRLEGGRIAERWGEWDGLSLLAQLRAS